MYQPEIVHRTGFLRSSVAAVVVASAIVLTTAAAVPKSIAMPAPAKSSSGPSPSASQSSSMSPATSGPAESCFADVVTYPPVPIGFEPLSATATQLQKYGLPPRPPADNLAAVKEWEQVVGHAQHLSNVDPICGGPPHRMVSSSNWAGHVVPYTYVGSVPFTWSESEWSQPSVPGDSRYSNWQGGTRRLILDWNRGLHSAAGGSGLDFHGDAAVQVLDGGLL